MDKTEILEERIYFEFDGKTSFVNVRFFGKDHFGNLLALHGLGTQGYCFDNLAVRLKQNLIAIDWYGYGKSDRRLGKNDQYGAQTCANWLLAAISALQNKRILATRFSIIAMSMSAIPVALAYNKLPAEKIVLIHPAGLDKKINRKLAFGLTSGILSDIALRFITLRLVWEFIWKFTTIASSNERRQYIRDDVMMHKGEFEVLRRYSRSGFTIFGHMRKTHYLPDFFEKISCPVFLLYGNDSVFYQKKYVLFAEKAGWKTKYVSSAPHNLIRSHAECIADPINDFLCSSTVH